MYITMKKKILKAFKALGFIMEDLDGGYYYGFEYEAKHFLYIYNENDENFLTIACPTKSGKDDMGELKFYQLMDKVNFTLKYIKAYTQEGNIWLYYERDIYEEDNIEKVIERMIPRLEAGFDFIRRELKDSDNDNDTDGEENTETKEDTENEDVA